MSAIPTDAITAPLRCATAGSVDDGKSTLIGRLLFDAKALMTDQIAHIDEASRRRGLSRVDLALLTDGLRAEREQGITIDVAWRFFATPRRRFILADSPGHVQYTRNMVTACSTADAAIVLLDARRAGEAGADRLAEQSRRHLFIARLLGVRSIVVVVNKMDAVGYQLPVYERIRDSVLDYLAALPTTERASDVSFIPVSALVGDNVVESSPSLGWYQGPTLLEKLESLPADVLDATAPCRLPVQWVIRPQSAEHPDFRGYAGRLAAGVLAVGDEVRAVTAGLTSRVVGIDGPAGPVQRASAGDSIVVRLADELDIARGEVLVREGEPAPKGTRSLTADLAWLHAGDARPGQVLLLKHGTREVRATIAEVEGHYEIADGSLRRDGHAGLRLNDLARVRIETHDELPLDAFSTHRVTGTVIVVDSATGDTLAGGMVRSV